MNLGNRNWQEYWVKETYARFWADEESQGTGADGILADNTWYSLPGRWSREGHPDQDDVSADY